MSWHIFNPTTSLCVLVLLTCSLPVGLCIQGIVQRNGDTEHHETLGMLISERGGTIFMHPSTHFLPSPLSVSVGPHDEYSSFVHTMVSAFAQRPLGIASLQYYLNRIATRESVGQGEWVEFGVFKGGCIRMMSDKRRALGTAKVIHGFDSFAGLPSNWRNSDLGRQFEQKWLHRGSFSMGGKPPFDEPFRFKWHVGWFNETVSSFAKDPNIGNVSFAHMDADMYISTAQALQGIAPKLAPGAYIVFDELIGYPEYEENEMKALFELAKLTGRTIKVIGYEGGGDQLVEDPAEIRKTIRARHGEYIPQNALVQIA